MPARRDGGRAAGPGAPRRAGSAAAASGRGRRARASRSATAGASPPASWSNTKPQRRAPDANPDAGRRKPAYVPRYLSTASTRRWSLPVADSSSLAKMFVTYFSTALGLTFSSATIPLLDRPLGHEPQHLQLPRGEPVDLVVAPADQELRDDLRVQGRAAGRHPAH